MAEFTVLGIGAGPRMNGCCPISSVVASDTGFWLCFLGVAFSSSYSRFSSRYYLNSEKDMPSRTRGSDQSSFWTRLRISEA